MAQPDHDSNETYGVWQGCVLQPAERIIGINKVRKMRPGWQMRAPDGQRIDAPRDHQDDHHRGDVHDPQCLLARLGNSFDVFPPEVERAQYCKECSGSVDWKLNARMEIG